MSPYCFCSGRVYHLLTSPVLCRWFLVLVVDVLVVDDGLQALLEGADRLRISQTVPRRQSFPLQIQGPIERNAAISLHPCAHPWFTSQERELIV
jgi:hypothetical protein